MGGVVVVVVCLSDVRFLGELKRMVKNKARLQGSIGEAYLGLETSHFVSYYFGSHVLSMRTHSKRNEFQLKSEVSSVFNLHGCPASKAEKRYLAPQEVKAAYLHVLLNCNEVQPYLE